MLACFQETEIVGYYCRVELGSDSVTETPRPHVEIKRQEGARGKLTRHFLYTLSVHAQDIASALSLLKEDKTNWIACSSSSSLLCCNASRQISTLYKLHEPADHFLVLSIDHSVYKMSENSKENSSSRLCHKMLHVVWPAVLSFKIFIYSQVRKTKAAHPQNCEAEKWLKW